MQVCPLKLLRILVEEINIVLDDVLGVGELLVDGVRANVVVILIVFAVADEVDLLFVLNQRVVVVDMVDNLAVLMFLQPAVKMGVADERVYHVFKHKVEFTHKHGLLIVVVLALDVLRLLEEGEEQVPKLHHLVGEILAPVLP